MFSPYYARARKSGPAEPLNHCAMNVCLYGPLRHRWAMTERSGAAVARDAATFNVGPSRMSWEGDALTIRLDETANPIPEPIRGVIRLRPEVMTDFTATLDDAGRHLWRPIAPRAHVEVALDKPALAWRGHGYFDSNFGAEPLEDGFSFWNWSRAPARGGAAVLYDAVRREGGRRALALSIDKTGKVERMEPPRSARLAPTMWLMRRETMADDGCARVEKTLEDTPFYTRSVISGSLFGERVRGMHESLCLDRFRSAWVQRLLPYRMPRR
ncbi:MAG: hypothetical protein NW215_04460 [Hyphomicrobiales bacterium]|nr:hypothetical protein [Hyphomicrobiales bacterium]